MLGIEDDTNLRKQNALKQGRRPRNVTFNDEEIVINPEDVDPNVGRFRNLVQTTVVPAKRARFDVNHMGIHSGSSANAAHLHQMFQQTLADMKHGQNHREMPPPNTVPHSPTNSLYQGLPAEAHGKGDLEPISPLSIGSKLGLLLPNPAPDVMPVFDEAEEASSSLAQKLAMANANGKDSREICIIIFNDILFLFQFVGMSKIHTIRVAKVMLSDRRKRNMPRKPGLVGNPCWDNCKYPKRNILKDFMM